MLYYFVFELNIKENKKAKPTAAAIPADVASKPPVNVPKRPLDSTPDIAPFAREAPKPTIGTFIPA